jgi:hypothetical protein
MACAMRSIPSSSGAEVMGDWVGPALIAAIVSGLVSVFGWFATFYIGLRRDRMLRDEKVHDFQIALRAEISSDLLTMVVADRAMFLADVENRYRSEPGYSAIIPHMASNPIFGAILEEIYLLPAEVIEPVVHYERLRETLERFVADMREPSFSALSAERQMLMYSDYIDMIGRLESLAKAAASAITASLSNWGAGRSNPVSASAMDEAAASRQDDP